MAKCAVEIYVAGISGLFSERYTPKRTGGRQRKPGSGYLLLGGGNLTGTSFCFSAARPSRSEANENSGSNRRKNFDLTLAAPPKNKKKKEGFSVATINRQP